MKECVFGAVKKITGKSSLFMVTLKTRSQFNFGLFLSSLFFVWGNKNRIVCFWMDTYKLKEIIKIKFQVDILQNVVAFNKHMNKLTAISMPSDLLQ